MSLDNILYSNRLVDNQTGREVEATSLTEFSLAGWENFQDSQYKDTNKLTVADDTDQKVTFQTPVLFGRFERQPEIKNVKYPIWDFDDQKIVSYKENNLGNGTVRLQMVAESTTNAQGVGVEVILRIPGYLDIYRETKAISKGTAPQRLTYNIPFYYDQNTIDSGVEIYVHPVGDAINFYNFSVLLKNW